MENLKITLEHAKKVFDWWGRHEAFYAALMKVTFLGRESFFRRMAISSLLLQEGDTVLEVGCGTGRNFSYLLEHVGPNGQIIGIDYSSGMLAQALKLITNNGWKNIQLIHGDAARVTFRSESFDAVISSCAMSAIPDYENTLRISLKSLKKGKRLVILDAKRCEGPAGTLNPIIIPLFQLTTNWDPERDIIGALRRMASAVHVRTFNNGCLYIGVAKK